MKRFEPKVLAMLLAGFSLALPVGHASAARLGDPTTLSATGQALRVEIASPGSTAERVDACIRVAAPARSTDGIPFVRAASVSATGRGPGARIVVTHPEPVFDPILKLVLQNVCESRMTREYTLLLPEPVELASPVAVTSPQPRPAAPRPARASASDAARATQTWTTVAGESVASIAQAMYPRDAGARNAFIAGVLQANPGLFGDTSAAAAPLPQGTALNIPSLTRVAAASTEPRARATPRQAAARPTAAAPAAPAAPAPSTPPAAASVAAAPPPVTPADRLVLQQDADRETRPSDETLSQAAADELLAREDVLVSAIDRTINSQLEMLERLRRLEEIQTALHEQLQLAEAPLTQLAASASGTASGSMPSAVPEDRIPEREVAPAAQHWPEWWKLAAAALAIALLLLLLMRRRESDSASVAGARAHRGAPSTEWLSEVPTRAGEPTRREVPAQAETPRPPAQTAALEWEADARRAGIAADEATAAPFLPQEDEVVEEHESAVELADIMVSFGRLRGAADTLAEFIRSNPKQALAPWLKLMDIYRAAGMKPEFDTLARQLNMTFNVKAVTWENFEASRKDDGGLESMPHILEKVLQLWGRRECQGYLETIVRDNRGGTRQGFGLSVIDDIVVLVAILEEHLGRYRPTSP